MKILQDYYDKDLIDEETQNSMKPKFINKKRKRRTKSELRKDREEKEKNKNNETKKKKGRKSKDDNSKDNNSENKDHNKYRLDNIFKKIKGNLFDLIVKIINNQLTVDSKGYYLKKIDYDYVNQLKRDVDLEYLDMTIKELLSKNISPKFKKLEKSMNATNIEKILQIEKDNNEINYIFSLTFREWIDIFTLKKKSSIKIKGIGDFLKTIYENNKEKRYFSLFVYCLYNYERWFLYKKGRNSKDKSSN